MNIQHPLFQEEMAQIAALPLPYDRLDGKTVAMTGASGLIGCYLMRALDALRRAHGLRLRLLALCRNPESARARLAGIDGLECLAYDACAPLAPDFQADYVLHAASNAHPLAFSADPVGTMQANILGTMHLLERIRRTGGRFVLFSTGEIYGERLDLPNGFDENSFGALNPMNARACYPESKRAAETLCAAYARQYGADALAARLGYVYGASITRESSRADAQFLRKALNGEDIVLKSDGSQLRSYCYAADAAAALIVILLRGATATAYNVADPNSVSSIRNYAQTLAALGGVRVVFDLPPENERSGYSAVTRAVLNADRLLELGWTPKYALREGLRRTLAISRED